MAETTRASPLLILLLTLFHLPDSSSITAVAQPPARPWQQQQNSSKQHRQQQPALVQSTCNSTTFYDVCIAALAADPSSSTADVAGLCGIAVSAAAANASGTAAFLLGNASGAGAAGEAAPAEYHALLRACAGKYAAARDALLQARASLAEQDYDYAFVHVSAAGEYPAVCRTLFRRRQQQQQRQRGAGEYSSYPPELARREEALRRLCTIALDIISLLQNQET